MQYTRRADRRMPLPAFDAEDLTILGVVFGLAGVLFGFAVARDLSAAPLYEAVARGYWVAAFLIGGCSILGGLAAKWHRSVWLGNGLLMTAYGSMAVGLFIVATDRAVVYAAVFVPFAIIHGFAWARLGFRVPAAHTVHMTAEDGDT